jgi:cob(I)alamin adenosyltransferase
MSITTKRGDKGTTDLLAGKRVAKDDIRIEVCGELDELAAFLGMAKSLINKGRAKLITSIQKDLLVIGSVVACPADKAGRLAKNIVLADIKRLEAHIYRFEKNDHRKKKFCLQGDCFESAVLDICRVSSRRVERRLVTLNRKKGIGNPNILVYLNRLSDLLYLMARAEQGKSVAVRV